MKTVLSLVLTFTSFLGVAPSVSQGKPADNPRQSATLGSVNIISSSGPAEMKVRLPVPISVKNPWHVEDPSRVLEVDGSGSLVGFVLEQDIQDEDRKILLGGRIDTGDERMLFIMELNRFVPDGLEQRSVKLPAGDYRLYVVGVGQVRVTLRLSGLKGDVELSPEGPVREVIKPLTHYDPTTTNVASGGATGSVSGKGLLFQAVGFTTSGHVASQHDACAWRGVPSQPWATMPNCGDAEVVEPPGLWYSAGTIDRRSGNEHNTHMYFGDFLVDSRKKKVAWGQSWSVQTAAQVDKMVAVGLWLEFL